MLLGLQLINILTLGNPNGIGNFFPKGLGGAIKTPTGYNETASGLDDFPFASNTAIVDTQVNTMCHLRA